MTVLAPLASVLEAFSAALLDAAVAGQELSASSPARQSFTTLLENLMQGGSPSTGEGCPGGRSPTNADPAAGASRAVTEERARPEQEQPPLYVGPVPLPVAVAPQNLTEVPPDPSEDRIPAPEKTFARAPARPPEEPVGAPPDETVLPAGQPASQTKLPEEQPRPSGDRVTLAEDPVIPNDDPTVVTVPPPDVEPVPGLIDTREFVKTETQPPEIRPARREPARKAGSKSESESAPPVAPVVSLPIALPMPRPKAEDPESGGAAEELRDSANQTVARANVRETRIPVASEAAFRVKLVPIADGPRPEPSDNPVPGRPAKIPTAAPEVADAPCTVSAGRPGPADESPQPRLQPQDGSPSQLLVPLSAPRDMRHAATSETAAPPAGQPEWLREAEVLRQEPMAAESKPVAVKDVRLEVNGSGRRVEVRLTEQAGEVRVAVRTPDSRLAADLREKLPALSSRLEAAGFRAEGLTHESGHFAAEQRRESLPNAESGSSQSGTGQRGREQGQRDPQPRHPRTAPETPSSKPKREDFAWFLSTQA